MMKRKSIVLLILFSFWMVYSSWTIGYFFVEAKKLYQADTDRRKSVVDFHFDNARHFLINDKIDALLERLNKARAIGEFDFFILRQNDKVLGFYNKQNDLVSINYDYKVTDNFRDNGSVILKTISVLDQKLTLGINISERDFLWNQFWMMRFAILKDLIVVTIVVFLIAYLVLKDILQISKALQSKNRESVKNVKARSTEAETLLRATLGFEDEAAHLRTDNLLLASSLGPAIKNELKSDRTPPYSFKCTLVRVDMNGYTKMFMQKTPGALFHILNEYFKHSRELIERYHGLIYQYIGDEIIFFFKSEDPQASARMALACVRSLFEMAEDISTEDLPEGIRLKASLVSGELHFVKLDQGHAFSGLPLIESVRMLGQVQEKSENRLIVYSEMEEILKDLCQASGSKMTVFKGFDREAHLLEITDFTKRETVTAPIALTTYFRGNKDVVFVLEKLLSFVKENKETSFFELLKPIWTYRINESHPKILASYKNLICECFKMKLDELSESKFLSTTVSLAQQILTPEQLDTDLKIIFDSCEKSLDPRVVANTISTKSFFNQEIQEVEEKLRSSSNRLSANVLLNQGQQNMSDKVVDKIQEFLDSPQPQFVASGLYLIGALYDYHRQRDTVYVRTNRHFQTLAAVVPQYFSHPNVMVKERARLTHHLIQGINS